MTKIRHQIQRTCRVCGKDFMVYPTRIRNTRAEFCSQSCYAYSRRDRMGPNTRVSQVPTLSEPESAWLAGAIDGEGSIMIHKASRAKGPFPELEVDNTDIRFVKRCADITNVHTVYLKKPADLEKGWKAAWMWKAKGHKDVESILKQVLPYLIIKSEQAQIVLAFLDVHFNIWSPDSSRVKNELVKKIGELNQK